MFNAFLGILVIAIGSFCQSSSYVPIKKIRKWSWESFWLAQGLFAWIVFPMAGAFLSLPHNVTIMDLIASAPGSALKSVGFGMLWGIGGLTFGLSMRYLGVALGQSISLGTCAAFGTLLPALFAGDNLFSGEGLVLLTGVSITIAGIAVIGYAASLRSKTMSDSKGSEAVKEFALTKGLSVAVLAGVMSACFNLGLSSGLPLRAEGMNPMLAALPATFMVTTGGFITNAVYCIYMNWKNNTFHDYAGIDVLVNNLLYCALAGLLWYSQFFGLSAGNGFFTEGSLLSDYSWCILMSLNVIFSNVWGVILKEWKGVSTRTFICLISGICILILSLIFPNL